jgi:hypothetical protein
VSFPFAKGSCQLRAPVIHSYLTSHSPQELQNDIRSNTCDPCDLAAVADYASSAKLMGHAIVLYCEAVDFSMMHPEAVPPDMDILGASYRLCVALLSEGRIEESLKRFKAGEAIGLEEYAPDVKLALAQIILPFDAAKASTMMREALRVPRDKYPPEFLPELPKYERIVAQLEQSAYRFRCCVCGNGVDISLLGKTEILLLESDVQVGDLLCRQCAVSAGVTFEALGPAQQRFWYDGKKWLNGGRGGDVFLSV